MDLHDRLAFVQGWLRNFSRDQPLFSNFSLEVNRPHGPAALLINALAVDGGDRPGPLLHDWRHHCIHAGNSVLQQFAERNSSTRLVVVTSFELRTESEVSSQRIP